METDADGNVLSETAVAADAEATVDDETAEYPTRARELLRTVNANAGDVHPDSDSE